MSDLDRLVHAQGRAAHRAALALADLSQLEPAAHLDVPPDVHAAQVEFVLVGARREARAAAQGLVGHDARSAHADRAETPGRRAERCADLLVRRGPQL